MDRSFREMMGVTVSTHESLPALSLDEGLDGPDWPRNEFDGAPLGDKRRTARLVESAVAMAQQPGRSFSSAVEGDRAAVKGYYRLIDLPDESAVTMDNILKPHRERTTQRMKSHETVLCIQDGSDLNFSSLDQCKGLGSIGTNQTGAHSMGLHLHSTFAVTTDGLPIGVLRAEAIAPESRPADDTRPDRSIPIEEKKSFSWVEGFRDCIEVAQQIPDTHLISVMDREADIFELFDEQRCTPSVDLLVRAQHDRKLSIGHTLFEAAHEAPPCAQLAIPVPRQSARPKKSKQKARPDRKARIADVTLRYRRVELPCPQNLPKRDPVTMWIIEALEEKPAKGVIPLCWHLLTTMEIGSPEQAQECLSWYCLRWRIEDWHRVLKTGCRIEKLGNFTAERLRRGIAVNLVIAWRIMLMTLLGSEQPEQPADLLFSDIEIEVLSIIAKKKSMKPPTKLGDAVLQIARLGGYLARKSDPPPGHEVMWRGFTRFLGIVEGYSLFKDP